MQIDFNSIPRKVLIRLWSLGLFVLILLCFYPISYGLIRLSIVSLTAILYLGLIYLTSKNFLVRSLLILFLSILSIFAIAPGREFITGNLRNAYISQLNKYEGTNYIWGGENKIGIDCSGLVRQGLIQANFNRGILTLNPALVRQAFSLWWYDSSALALRDGYRNYTSNLFASDKINLISELKIQPGDLAVTQDGVHILAYTGKQTWIEADPIYKKVIKVKVPNVEISWFNTPVYILRWQQFIDRS